MQSVCMSHLIPFSSEEICWSGFDRHTSVRNMASQGIINYTLFLIHFNYFCHNNAKIMQDTVLIHLKTLESWNGFSSDIMTKKFVAWFMTSHWNRSRLVLLSFKNVTVSLDFALNKTEFMSNFSFIFFSKTYDLQIKCYFIFNLLCMFNL